MERSRHADGSPGRRLAPLLMAVSCAVLLAVLVIVLGGGSADDDRPVGTVRVDLVVENGAVVDDPGPIRTRLGDRVEISILSDESDRVHLHGYDIESDVVAGRPSRLEFDASVAGRFEVETHESRLVIATVEVR